MGNYSKYPKQAGIYKITCNVNNKVYIGKAINIRDRINNHKNVKRKSKGMFYFQYALLKYGWESFSVDILEIVENFDKLRDNESLLKREAHYIELFDSTNTEKGYNRCKFSTDATGIPCSQETKIKIGNANRGRFVSAETKEKLSVSHLGKIVSEETRKKMGDMSRGNQHRLGTKHSEEVKRKMSESRVGKQHTEESKKKMRKPKVKRENLGKSFLGRKHSEETKEKMRQVKLKQKENM